MKEYNLDFDDALVVASMLANKTKKLVSFDKHFDKISENKIIEVWSISKAIENLLSEN